MITFLAFLRPYLIPLGIALAGLLCVSVQTWRLHSAQTEIAETGRLLDAAIHTRDSAIAANAGLMQRITAQNQAVANMATQGQAKEKTAQKAAVKVLARPAPKIEGHGPEVMNQFIQALFGD